MRSMWASEKLNYDHFSPLCPAREVSIFMHGLGGVPSAMISGLAALAAK